MTKRERYEARVDLIITLCSLAFVLLFGYHVIAFGVWQFRNPRSTGSTVITHYREVMSWKALPEYQYPPTPRVSD